MSVFGKIKEAIFGRQAEAAESPAANQSGVNSSTGGAQPNPARSTPATAPSAPQAAPSGASPEPRSAPARTTAAPGAPTGAAPAPSQQGPASGAAASVDVEAVMNKAVAASGQKLDWRHSIVDMMKALDLDSSLSERKELAQELGYGGDTNDSATMNVWLHKALMKKLAENGGKVPAGLTD